VCVCVCVCTCNITSITSFHAAGRELRPSSDCPRRNIAQQTTETIVIVLL